MARSWFTTNPDKYFLRLTRKGHRNEVLFTILGRQFFSRLINNSYFVGLAYLHYHVFNKAIEKAATKELDQKSDWKPTLANGAPFTVHPNKEYNIKFLA